MSLCLSLISLVLLTLNLYLLSPTLYSNPLNSSLKTSSVLFKKVFLAFSLFSDSSLYLLKNSIAFCCSSVSLDPLLSSSYYFDCKPSRCCLAAATCSFNASFFLFISLSSSESLSYRNLSSIIKSTSSLFK